MDPMMMMLLASGVLSATGIGASKEKHGSTFDKGQKGGLNDILESLKGMKGNFDINQNPEFQQGQEWLHSLYNDPEFFKSFEAPLQRDFEENTIPNLANRFASMGSGGSTGSTAFRNQLGREGSNLSTNIAALRGGMQQQGVNQGLQYANQPFQNMMQMYNQALNQGTQNTYQGPTAGPFGDIFAGLSSGVAQGYGQQWGKNQAGQYPGTT
jgi:hypothetical protein